MKASVSFAHTYTVRLHHQHAGLANSILGDLLRELTNEKAFIVLCSEKQSIK